MQDSAGQNVDPGIQAGQAAQTYSVACTSYRIYQEIDSARCNCGEGVIVVGDVAGLGLS